MNLCIDAGNTRSKWAVFDQDKLIESGDIIDENIFLKFKISRAILSNVVKNELFENIFIQKTYW